MRKLLTYIGIGLILLIPVFKKGYAYNVPRYMQEYENLYKSRDKKPEINEPTPAPEMFIPFPLQPPQIIMPPVPFKIANTKPASLDEINLDPPTQGIIKKARIESVK